RQPLERVRRTRHRSGGKRYILGHRLDGASWCALGIPHAPHSGTRVRIAAEKVMPSRDATGARERRRDNGGGFGANHQTGLVFYNSCAFKGPMPMLVPM